MQAAGGERNALGAAAAYYNSSVEQAPVFLFLLVAVPLALSLWTVFRDRFGGGAEALALGSFLTGHTLLLEGGARFALTWAGYLSGHSSVTLPKPASVAFVTGYVGIACWGCFGPGWKPALKGTLSGAWAWVESFAVVGVFFAGTAFWLLSAYLGAYYFPTPGETQMFGLIGFAPVFSVPLLLHVGAEAYYRLW